MTAWGFYQLASRQPPLYSEHIRVHDIIVDVLRFLLSILLLLHIMYHAEQLSKSPRLQSYGDLSTSGTHKFLAIFSALLFLSALNTCGMTLLGVIPILRSMQSMQV